MTNEQAITSLRNIRTFHNGTYAEAIDMAIKALGSWDKYSDELWKKAYKRGYDDGVDAYAKHIGLCREEAEEEDLNKVKQDFKQEPKPQDNHYMARFMRVD